MDFSKQPGGKGTPRTAPGPQRYREGDIVWTDSLGHFRVVQGKHGEAVFQALIEGAWKEWRPLLPNPEKE